MLKRTFAASTLLLALYAPGAFAEETGAETAPPPAPAASPGAPASAPARPLPAPAPLFPTALTRNDLSNLREVCGLAARAPGNTLEQIGGIATYCQELLVRLGNALSSKESPK